MKKILIYGGIILLAIAVIVVVVMMIMSIYSRNKFRKETLESCSASTGGGMLGGYGSAKLTRDDEGNAILVIQTKRMHNARMTTTTYKVDEEAFDIIKEMVYEYKLYAASKRPMSSIHALDAETTTLSFDFESDWFSIHQDQVLSKKMSEGFREVESYLYSLARGEGVTTIEQQEARLYLPIGYTLIFFVEDEFGGRLDDILSEGRDVAKFDDCGIIMAEDVTLDVGEATPVTEVPAGVLVYDAQGKRIIIMYSDCKFEGTAYVLATLDTHIDSACELIAAMEGEYRLVFN